MENLVFDGTTIGILDFNNMACGPRIYELAAPLHTIYELSASQNLSTHSSWLADLVEALLTGYGSQIQLSQMELKGFSLIQALRLFAGLGWAVGRQHLSGWKDWLEQYGAATVNQILALLDEYESNAAVKRFFFPKLWLKRAVKFHLSL
jgi:Ser/Thr protein kinase RdoA (MazF antagonist)